MNDVILRVLLVIVVLVTKMLNFLDPVHNYGSGGFAVTLKWWAVDLSHGTETFTQTIAKFCAYRRLSVLHYHCPS